MPAKPAYFKKYPILGIILKLKRVYICTEEEPKAAQTHEQTPTFPILMPFFPFCGIVFSLKPIRRLTNKHAFCASREQRKSNYFRLCRAAGYFCGLGGCVTK